MIKTAALLILILLNTFFTSTLCAQSWKWALSSDYKTELAGGRSYTNPEGITVVAGSYMDSIKIGNTRLINEGSGKFFIAVINADGSVSHCFSDGESFPELEPVSYGMIYATTMDKDNNILIAGQGTSTFTLGTHTYSSPGNSFSFVAKYSYDGTLLWSKAFSSEGFENSEWMNDMKTDQEGNVYGTGYFREGDVDLIDTVLHSSSKGSAYLIKYNSEGEFQWVKTATKVDPSETAFGSQGLSVSVDHQQHVYWSGLFSGNMAIEDQTLDNTNAGGNVFIAALSQTNGELSWLINDGGTGDYIHRSMVCGDSLLILAGICGANAKYGDYTLDFGTFLTAYNPDGTCKWAKNIVVQDPSSTEFSYSFVTALFMDSTHTISAGGIFAGELIVGGTALASVERSPDIFLVSTDPTDGETSLLLNTGTAKVDFAWSIGIDQCGNHYYAGHYIDSTAFGDHKLVNDGMVSLFVAQYENNPDCLLPTAIATNQSATGALTLYPNPAQQVVNIAFRDQPKEEVTVIVYNEMGKMESLQFYEVNGTHLKLPIRLVPGLYFIKVISSSQTCTSKLVIE